MRSVTQTLLSAVDSSATGANSSVVIDLEQVCNFSLAFTTTNASAFTATAAVTFSNDGVNYGADAAAPANPTITTNGTKVLNYPNVGARYAKIDITKGGTGGNVTVSKCDKGA